MNNISGIISDTHMFGPFMVVITIALFWTILFVIMPFVRHAKIKRQIRAISQSSGDTQELVHKGAGVLSLQKEYLLKGDAEVIKQILTQSFSANGLTVIVNEQGTLHVSGISRIMYNVNAIDPLDFTHGEIQFISGVPGQVTVRYHVSFEKFINFFLWFYVVLFVLLFLFILLLWKDFSGYRTFLISLIASFAAYFAYMRCYAQKLATSNFIDELLISSSG